MKKGFLLLALLVTGCVKVGPNFTPPPVPIQQEWLQGGFLETEDRICCWWKQLNDPVLNQLIEIARCANLDLQAAAFRILEARAELGVAIGEWFPQKQEAFGSSTRVKLSRSAPNVVGADRNFWDSLLGLQAVWELDFWGRFRRGIESADENLLASFANFDDVLVLLLSDVASVYVNIRTIEGRIAILKKNIALQARSLEIVQAKWESGMVTELDYQQARTLLYGTESSLPPLEAELRIAQNALAVLLGMTPDEIEPHLCGPAPIPVPPKSVAIGIPAELLCRRPDIRRALHLTAAQSARIGIAISDLLPRISLNGVIGFEGASSTSSTAEGAGKFFSINSLTYLAGPSIAWPIFNYGRLTNRVRLERARFCEFVKLYQNTVLKAYEEVENGLITFVKAQEELAKLEESVAAAERSTVLSRTQYIEGWADYTRVLDTERAQLEEEEKRVNTKGGITLSLIAVYRALGGGWECASY